MVKGVDACIMAVAPIDPNCIGTHFFDVEHLKYRFVHLKRVLFRGGVVAFLGLRAVCSGTGCARTFIAQVAQGIFTSVAILPVDLDSLGFGNCNVFG